MDTDDELKRFVQELSKHIGKGWKPLARALQFNQTTIEAVEYAHPHDLPEQIHDFFYRWKQQQGCNASVDKLVEGLRTADLEGLLGEVEKESRVPTGSGFHVVPLTGSQGIGGATADREFVRQQRLKRFQPSTSSDAGPNDTPTTTRSLSMASTGSGTLSDHGGEEMVKSPSGGDVFPSPKSPSSVSFEVCDMVKWERGSETCYGVVKWVGTLPGSTRQVAGIEVDEELDEGHSGEFKGVKYFDCAPRCGIFLPFAMLKKDDRFDDPPESALQGLKLCETDKSKEDEGQLSPHEEADFVNRPPDGSNSLSPGTPSDAKAEQLQGLESTPPSAYDKDLLQFLRGPALKESTASQETSHPTSVSMGHDSTPLRKGSFPASKDSPKLLPPLHASATSQESPPPSSESTGERCVLVFHFPGDQTGIIIGRDGANIREVEGKTGTKIDIRKADKLNVSTNGKGIITGTEEKCKEALCMILEGVRRKIARHIAVSETMEIPTRNLCGRVIGSKGRTCLAIEKLSGAKLHIESQKDEGLDSFLFGDIGTQPRKCEISGTPEQIENAKELVQRAMDGQNIARLATTAAVILILMKEFREMGFEFEDVKSDLDL